MVLSDAFIAGRCRDVWKCILSIYLLTCVLDPHYHVVDGTGKDCIFINAGSTTTISPNENNSYIMLHCAETCCCNKPACCLCNTSSTSGLTFIPCDVDTAVPVSPLPPLLNSWVETDYPLYEECYENYTTSSSAYSQTTSPDITTTTVPHSSGTTDPNSGVTTRHSSGTTDPNSGVTTRHSSGTTDPNSGVTTRHSSGTTDPNSGGVTTQGPTTTTDQSPTQSIPSPTNQFHRQSQHKAKASSGISNTSLIAIACILGLLALIALVGLVIYAVKRKNRKTMQIEDERKLRPMTPGPRSTYLHLPDIKERY